MNSRRSLQIDYDNAKWEAEQFAKDSEYAKFKDMIERAGKHFHHRDRLKIYSKSHAVTDENGDTQLHLNTTELTPLSIISAFRTVLDMMEEGRKKERVAHAKHRIKNMEFY